MSIATTTRAAVTVEEHIVEVVSDSGEGAQRCGQSLGAIAAKMGNGIWTVEIIPAEIQPPARSVAGASGVRIRIGQRRITCGGDEADLVVAFNEQVLLGRVRANEFKPGATILLESMWRDDADGAIAASYAETVERLIDGGFRVIEIPMEVECRKLVSDPRRGKNMFALGMLCHIYSLDLSLAREQVRMTFRKKDERVVTQNIELLEAGWAWAEENLDFRYAIPAKRSTDPQIVVNGNTARSHWVYWRPGWTSARCTRSRLPPPPRTISATCSSAPAGSSTRPRTRSPRARSRSERPTRADARSRSPRARVIRSSRRPSGSPRWRKSRLW
jgi:2-oxoglutarate/2-oxoacid ferredoxin oxidoreductase subunit alpha